MEKKIYSSPRLSAFGTVDDLTGVFGDPSTGDVSFNLSGDIIQTGNLSVDQCPTADDIMCDYRDRPL